MNIPPAWLQTVAAAINHYLALDPDLPPQWQALQGKVLAVDVQGLSMTCFIIPEERCLKFYQTYESEPDVVIVGPPLALLRLLTSKQPEVLIQKGDIEMRGDAQLGHQFKRIMSSLDIDWEELLAQRIGDIPAHKLGSIVRDFRLWRQRSHASLEQTLSEYLQEEVKYLPTRIEIENFMDEIDTVKIDTDRLQARVDALFSKQGEH